MPHPALTIAEDRYTAIRQAFDADRSQMTLMLAR